MSRRTNFIDGNENFREQNLRFVRNELEDNMNQFFGGAKGAPGMALQQQKPPARDSLIVQPTPGGRRGAIIGTGNPEVDERRQFLRQLGVNRNKARSLVKRSFKVPSFNLRDFQRKRFRLSVELGDNRQKEVDAIVLREVFEFIEANEPSDRPRTPSPPRNINWNDNPNSPPPRSSNAILKDTFSSQAFQHNEEEQERFPLSRSPDVDQHGNDRWQPQQQQQQKDFPQSNNRYSNFQFDNRRMMEENENDHFRQPEQIDVDRHFNYMPQEHFNFTENHEDLERTNRSREMDDNRYSPRQMRVSRSPENRNDNYNNTNFERDFDNPDFNPHAREWDRNRDFLGDSQKNLNDRNLEFRNPDLRDRQLSPPQRNLNRGPDPSFRNKEPNYQRFVQMDDNNEDRVYLIRERDSDWDRGDIDDHIRSNEFQNEQRNYIEGRSEHFEDRRYNNPNHEQFFNNDGEFQRSDNFRQNFGSGDRDNRPSNFMNNEFLQDRNERNFNNNYPMNVANNRPPGCDFRNQDLSQFENDRFSNRRGQNLDGNDFHRNESFGTFLQRPNNEHFNTQGRGGPPIRSQPNIQNPDVDEFQRNQSLQHFSSDQRNRRGPMTPNTNRYQGNRTDIAIQSMRDEQRNNSRGGPQRTDRIHRPNTVTATITSQQAGDRRQPPPGTRTGNRNISIGNAPPVVQSQAWAETTNANRNNVANRVNVRPQVTENEANPPRTGKKRAAEPPLPSRLTLAELKQRKIAGKQRVFRIAGFEFPYMSGCPFRLPQPESESYALTFFEQKPNYLTNYLMEYLRDESHVHDDYNDDDDNSDGESIEEEPRFQDAGGKHRRFTNKKLRQRIRSDWSSTYRKNNYKCWHIWWKEFKWCGDEIEKQLEKFDNISVKHRFIPIYRNATNEQVISNVLKRAERLLGSSVSNQFQVMRTIFIIMNETFLENLYKKSVQQLQDIIRYIPNNLWLFKMRSMVYLWERHYDTVMNPQPDANAAQGLWKNPCFHWLAKQAFDELKTISEIAWPDHKNLFDGSKRN